jgi:hypothetical protein
VDGADGADGKCFGVEVGGFFGVVGVPEAEGVFGDFGLVCLRGNEMPGGRIYFRLSVSVN